MRPDASALREIEKPENVRIHSTGSKRHFWCGGGRVEFFRCHMGALVLERPLIAISKATRIQAHHFAAIAHDINAVAFNCRRRGNAALRPIEINVLVTFGDYELPKELAGFFIETHQNTAIPLMLWIARVTIVGAKVHTATCDYRRGMRFRAELDGPFNISSVARLKRGGQRTFAPC